MVVDSRDLSSLCNYVATLEAAAAASESRESAQLAALQVPLAFLPFSRRCNKYIPRCLFFEAQRVPLFAWRARGGVGTM